jgi:hypothetical protein
VGVWRQASGAEHQAEDRNSEAGKASMRQQRRREQQIRSIHSLPLTLQLLMQTEAQPASSK